MTRRFRDGHTETWWAADATLGGFGPDQGLRIVATTDPGSLPRMSSWYLLTNLPRPASRRPQQADLAEVVRLYGLRNWVEQGYKQVKGELGSGRLPGPQRPGHPPALGAGLLRVLVLLAELPRQPSKPKLSRRPTPRPHPRPRGGRSRPVIEAEPAMRLSWPQALRWVRAWLIPWTVLQRCWRSWSPAPPPRQLQVLLDAVAAGRPLHLYISP